MLEIKEVKNEPEVQNIRSPKKDPEKPLLDTRDMLAVMCIICAALITYVMTGCGFIVYFGRMQYYGSIVCSIVMIAAALFWTTQKIVRICHIRAKRKATERVSD